MLLYQVILFDVLILLVTGLAGYFPARLIERKSGADGWVSRIFLALISGYFILESLYAIRVTTGFTMQWLNFLPFLMICFLPDVNKNPVEMHRQNKRLLLIPVGILIFSCWYFTRSYSSDLLHLDHYPFIDVVSYASSAYGMKFSGTEVSFADAALYYPGQTRLNLYHFTDLWAAGGISELFQLPELRSLCFYVPVFFLTLMAAGLVTLPGSQKIPSVYLGILILAVCFANGKLLFAQDYFLLSVLDLHGIKLSLIIPVFLFLFRLRHHPQILLAFLLWLPQVNILLAVAMAFGLGIYTFRNMKSIRNLYSVPVVVGYVVFAIVFLFLLKTGSGPETAGPEKIPFSFVLALKTTFLYLRESLFNLWFNYWAVFVVLAALVNNRNALVLVVPYLVAKVISKIAVLLLPVSTEWMAGPEVLMALCILYFLEKRYPVLPLFTGFATAILSLLCLTGAIGYSLTHFMDFEQIYTLVSGTCFLIAAFALFIPLEGRSGFLDSVGLSKFKWIAGSLVLGVVTWKTFRFQRVLPFDTQFYKQIEITIFNEEGDFRSAYFSSRRYSPFPLHIKAGFPLLFNWSSAVSTPVTMFEDSSWQGKNIEWHVRAFPFYSFCKSKPQFNEKQDVALMQADFLKKYAIRYLWVDGDYDQKKINFLEKAVQKKVKSEKDKMEFWIIDPTLL
jgi:hypothetical protein